MPLLMHLSRKDLNRITLSKHYLLSKSGEAIEVISRICGLNAQVASSPYLSLWNRVAEFHKDSLDRELYRTKRALKSWFMRGTVHIVPSNEYLIYRNALKESMLRDWNRYLKKSGGPSPEDVVHLSEGIIKALEEGELIKREIEERVKDLWGGYGEKERKVFLSRTIRGLSYQGLLCHTQPTGSWYHFRENRFARTDRWLPDLAGERVNESRAKKELLLRYLKGYGPATIRDFAYWTGYRAYEAKEAFDLTKDELAEAKVEDISWQFWTLKEDLKGLERGPSDEELPPHFLPAFDPLLMGHKEKSRLLNPAYRNRVFLPLADVAPTLLLDGMVTGTWSYRKGKDHLIMKISPFRRLNDQELREVKIQAEALSAFMDFGPLNLKIEEL